MSNRDLIARAKQVDMYTGYSYDADAFRGVIHALEKAEADLEEALRETAKYAREAGEAKGRLEMSEAAGIVEGWRERCSVAEKALEPFARFDLTGFDGVVLDVVPSTPDNPSPRIEPIWTSHFRRARVVLETHR